MQASCSLHLHSILSPVLSLHFQWILLPCMSLLSWIFSSCYHPHWSSLPNVKLDHNFSFTSFRRTIYASARLSKKQEPWSHLFTFCNLLLHVSLKWLTVLSNSSSDSVNETESYASNDYGSFLSISPWFNCTQEVPHLTLISRSSPTLNISNIHRNIMYPWRTFIEVHFPPLLQVAQTSRQRRDSYDLKTLRIAQILFMKNMLVSIVEEKNWGG